MHEKLENFERNQVWTLVEPPRDVNVIGTKWVFKNKQGEDDEIMRNKARLVAQGFSQVEGLDFGRLLLLLLVLRPLGFSWRLPHRRDSNSIRWK
jgi:hypothetical protein